MRGPPRLAAMAKETSSINSSLPSYEVLEAEFTALHGELPADYPSSPDANCSINFIISPAFREADISAAAQIARNRRLRIFLLLNLPEE